MGWVGAPIERMKVCLNGGRSRAGRRDSLAVAVTESGQTGRDNDANR